MIRTVATLIVFVMAALLTAGTAHAHGGPIKLEVQGDGGQGVNATVTYQNDGHMATDEFVLSYTAVTPDGRTEGPIRLIASTEGQAFYRSEKPLPTGTWTVTVTATKPSSATKTVAINSTALPAAPVTPPAVNSTPTGLIIALAIVLIAVVTAFATILRRRRLVGRT